MAEKIEHILVLMLENRSFDHMLGFLPRDGDYKYEGLKGTESNPSFPGLPHITVNNKARYALAVDPDHSHASVVEQLTGLPFDAVDLSDDDAIDMSGFVWNYEKRSQEEKQKSRHGELVMNCFNPRNIPVLAKLAREFALCDHWFASVPGATWPNRNYCLAATSHGKVNIELRPYWDKTIFESLGAAKKKWRIYHDGPSQSWAFPKLWDVPLLRNNFRGMKQLYKDIAQDALPEYGFIEPNHGLLLNNVLKDSNSQHPGNNIEHGRDFHAGEKLIAKLYTILRENYDVFRKTLLVITYDEHGGFYDHLPPPKTIAPDGHKSEEGFDIKRLGVRVPTVLISPLIEKRTVDSAVYDHSSIPATVRKLFAPKERWLTQRDRLANTFDRRVQKRARPLSDLPMVKAKALKPTDPIWDPPSAPSPEFDRTHLFGSHERNMIALAHEMERALDDEVRLGNGRLASMKWWERDEERIDELIADPVKLHAYLTWVAYHFRETAEQATSS